MEYVIVIVLIGFMAMAADGVSTQKEQRAKFWQSLQINKPEIVGEQRCPKCQRPMIQGFVPDRQEVGFRLSNWGEGPPQATEENVKYRLERSVPIGAYRCSTCGYLEFFAQPHFEPK
jgi:hypothetical protein